MGKEIPQIGYRVIGKVKSVKGECSAGHEEGDEFELSCYQSSGLCGFFYHNLFPWISVLQFGGKFPWGQEDVIELGCIDSYNEVKIELRRVK